MKSGIESLRWRSNLTWGLTDQHSPAGRQSQVTFGDSSIAQAGINLRYVCNLIKKAEEPFVDLLEKLERFLKLLLHYQSYDLET